MSYSGLLEIIREKARSAYAFIAVCDSSRMFERHPSRCAPRSGAAMEYNNTATRRSVESMLLLKPCAVAHGYKRMSATRFSAP